MWLAVATYALVAIVRKRRRLALSPHAMLQVRAPRVSIKLPYCSCFLLRKVDPKQSTKLTS